MTHDRLGVPAILEAGTRCRRVGGHMARPEHVVAQVQPSDTNAVPGRPPGRRIPVFVDVVVDDVEVTFGFFLS